MIPALSPTTPATQADSLTTLAQRLRFIDLCFECAAEAKRLFPPPMDGFAALDDAAPSNPSFDPAYRFLRLKAMRAEGLPLSLLGDGKTASQRHTEAMAEQFGSDWDHATWNGPDSVFARGRRG